MKIINNFLSEAKLQDFHIYCDMDEVIVDFCSAFENLGFGKEEEYKTRQSEFYKILRDAGESFWINASWTKDGKELWNFIKKFNPIILSAPTNDPYCKPGKIKWIKKELGSNIPYILDSQKYKYANDKAILIDDKEENIDQWKEHKGIGILHISAEDTIKQLFNL